MKKAPLPWTQMCRQSHPGDGEGALALLAASMGAY